MHYLETSVQVPAPTADTFNTHHHRVWIFIILGSSSTLNSEVSGISNSTYSTGHYNGVSQQIQGTSPHLTVSNTPGLTNAENTMIRLVNSISNESLAIDVKQLNDPDALWKRKKYG